MIPAYAAQTKEIALPRGQGVLKVRGLSLDDITAIIQNNLPAVIEAVDHYRASLTSVYSTKSMDAFVHSLAASFPALSAQVVAHAADDPGATDIVRAYPIALQFKAMLAVAELTLEDMDGLTNPSPALAALVRQVSGALALKIAEQPLPSSTGPLDEA